MDHILPCTPQGGSISRLYPTCYNTKVYIGGIYVDLDSHDTFIYIWVIYYYGFSSLL